MNSEMEERARARLEKRQCDQCQKIKSFGNKVNPDGKWLCNACSRARVRAINAALLSELPSFLSTLPRLGSE